MSEKENDQVVDCTKGYVPSRIDMAIKQKNKILQRKSKNSKEGVEVSPRRRHRTDGRKLAKEIIDGYVSSPLHFNPFSHGDSSTLKLGFEALLEKVDKNSVFDVIGLFNEEPITNYRDLEKEYGMQCFCDTPCEKSTGIGCVWQPYQLLTWGIFDLEKNTFVALPEKSIIRGESMTLWEFRNSVRKKMGNEEWKKYINKDSKELKTALSALPEDADDSQKDLVKNTVAAHRLIGSMQTMQRTAFTSNCYGLALHQFGYAIETFYKDLDTVCINLAINLRDPDVQTYREAKKMFKSSPEKTGKGKIEQKVSEVEVDHCNSEVNETV